MRLASFHFTQVDIYNQAVGLIGFVQFLGLGIGAILISPFIQHSTESRLYKTTWFGVFTVVIPWGTFFLLDVFFREICSQDWCYYFSQGIFWYSFCAIQPLSLFFSTILLIVLWRRKTIPKWRLIHVPAAIMIYVLFGFWFFSSID